MKVKRYITLLLIILSTSVASAQVTFEAKVSKTKLGVNERLRVDFEMNKDGDNFTPPSLKKVRKLLGQVKKKIASESKV